MMRCFLSLLLFSAATRGFVAFPSVSRYSIVLSVGGGKGWDSDNYLNNLDGDDEDRLRASEEYQDFSESRAAFMKRRQEQQQAMENADDQTRKFMLDRQRALQQDSQKTHDDDNDDWLTRPVDGVPNQQGGSRFAQMMAQSKQLRDRQNLKVPPTVGGFEQKFAVPIEDDEKEDEQ